MNRPRFLMCPPDHYGIEYEINPWMHRQFQPDRDKARSQWQRLKDLLETGLDAVVELIEPRPGLPDMVFTANAGYVEAGTFVPSRFRFQARQGEAPWFREWFSRQGFSVRELPGHWAFEGFGDALPWGDRIFAGYRFRSDIQSHTALGVLLGREVLSLELVDSRFYHLDTCLCPLSGGEVVYFPGAFDRYGRSVLEGAVGGERLLPVSESEAIRFCCNAVHVGTTIIMHTGSPDLAGRLTGRGYRVSECDLSEFLKSGGAARCLVCRLA
ncbi:MAG: arginine deiminase-related protein [Thermodesulfobacteriota bacterium]